MKMGTSARSWTAALILCGALISSYARADEAKGARPEHLSGERAVCAYPIRGQVFERTELFFGMNRPDGGVVSPEEFQGFIDTQVTPRFPDGLTVVVAKGQFRGTSGVTEREDSRILILLYTLDRQKNALIEEIREAYKNAFEQESVLRVDESSCVSF